MTVTNRWRRRSQLIAMSYRLFHDASTRSASALSSRARAGRLLRVSEFMRSPVGSIFQSASYRTAAAKSTDLLTIAERIFPCIAAVIYRVTFTRLSLARL